MSAARFPHRRPDGSFCIEVALCVETRTPTDLAGRAAEWLDEWVRNNQHWPWFGHDVKYVDELTGNPFHVEGSRLSFRLEGKPTAKWWKDFLVLRILKELQHAFSEIKEVEKIGDCPLEQAE